MPRIRRTDEEWMDLIRECKSSSVSDQVWLKQKKIPESSFYRKYQQLCGEVEQITPIPQKQLTEIPESHEIVQVRLEISNNAFERKCKVYAIGRRNFLFHETVDGAGASTIIYSLVETAKMNRLNVYSYL